MAPGKRKETEMPTTVTKTLPTVDVLAEAFSAEIRAALTPEELAEAIRLNTAETDSGICHTHDHHDANMYMSAAWEKLTGSSVDDDIDTEQGIWSQAGTDITNAAWAKAKRANFTL
jgi:hypothetical protein